MPFVQGHLRKQPVTVRLESECGHCRRPLRIEIGGGLELRLPPEAPGLLVYVPLVNFEKLRARSIIDDF